MNTYRQSTGEFTNVDGTVLGIGYSGNGPGLDAPHSQSAHNVGPIPQGKYTIGAPYADPHKGPVVMHLTPDPTNEMFGRDGFLIHGDNSKHDQSASEGCIVLAYDARMKIAESGDKQLEVIE